MKKLSLTLASALLILLAGCSEQSDGGAAAQMSMPPPGVDVLKIEPQQIDIALSLPGRVSAFKQSNVRPQVNGVITERLFKQGAEVEKGQQLYQIDDAQYAANLKSAEADVKSAQANVKTLQAKTRRYENLLKTNAISQQDYDDVVAELDQAKAAVNVALAAVDLAKVDLDYTKVYAPISGRISRSYFTEGTLVTSNQTDPLATITQLDPIYVDMQQSGSEALRLQQKLKNNSALPVSILINESTGEKYEHKGELEFSEVTVDESTGAITLRALMPNPDGVLLPGMFVRASIEVETISALLVPQRATMRQPDGSLVAWVVDSSNKATPRTITVSRVYKDSYVVNSGINAGETVIIAGYQKISAGATVTPSPWNNGQSSQAAH